MYEHFGKNASAIIFLVDAADNEPDNWDEACK